MDPVVRTLVCPSCAKNVNVRVTPTANRHVFHCPHCNKIVTAKE